MTLDHATQRELLDLLVPFVNSEGERRALLAHALGEDCPALPRIERGGSPETFVLRMAEALAGFGEVEPGKQALWKLLETVRARVEGDRKARIGALEPIVNRPVVGADPTERAPRAHLATARLGAGQSVPPPLHLRVFLASPGDVASERAVALQVLAQLPYDPLLRGRVTVEAVAWDKAGAGAPMLAGLTPQAAIAAGLPRPSACDIVIVILWSRMGTPLPAEYRKPDGSAYLSGTEWEYLEAREARARGGKPEILVYRGTRPYLIDADDPDFDDKRQQRDAVKAFFATFRNAGGSICDGSNEYAEPNDFRQHLDLHLRSVIRRLLDSRSVAPAASAESASQAERVAPAAAPPLWTGSPFPGLRAFTPDDAPIFFGRGRETDDLLRKLSDASTRFLMVVGASGSGKSSLVAAGLLPRLKGNAIEGSKDWLLPGVVSAGGPGEGKHWVGLRFTPGELGDDPFLTLGAKLAPLLPDQGANPRQVAERLRAKAAELVELAETALGARPRWAEALLFVDQFEELFTVVAERHRAPFVDMLAAAARAPRIRIVATLRADFYQHCVDSPTLAEILRLASYPLAVPGLAALFEMVTGPAARAGLEFETALLARMLDETGKDRGALALLAFALHELYRARTSDGRLTQQAYDAFGGVRGVIGQRAEETFVRLPAHAQRLLGGVFRDLVDVDERGIATRRRIARLQSASSAESARLVDAFVDARLLVTDRGPAGEAMLEVAHEALLREWPRLADWIREQADDLRGWREAQASATEWERSGWTASHLWPHERLGRAHETLSRLGIDRTSLDEPARSFLRPEAERLLEELDLPRTSHYRRAEIGDRLDRIGDPRPGIGVGQDGVPDIVWCEIPGGRVTLENVGGDFEVRPFLLAKYPVNYRQYRVFLDDPQGYRDQRWWAGLEHGAEIGEQYRQIGNCPAEHASWWDAMAYCRWLSAVCRLAVRLPTEPEWQQAATGSDSANQYPWGSWADQRANTSESRLGRTTAVGVYPTGVSAHGVFDLAGNVWEWCLTDYDHPLKSAHGTKARRVVRGGSWYDNRGYARCAYRLDYRPDFRVDFIGFRVARGPHTLNSD